MSSILKTISPVDNSIYLERAALSEREVERVFSSAHVAQGLWKKSSLSERQHIGKKFVEYFEQHAAAIAEELTWQMGRPISQTPGEVRGLIERARYMIEIAPSALEPIRIDARRFIQREPLGVVFTIAAWNYPYLIAVNSVIPALMAGNAVVLKHSTQTLLCAERFLKAFEYAGLPKNVFQILPATHEATLKALTHPLLGHVVFTGSTAAGKTIQQALQQRFIGLGLELGGKDPAYVREDANFSYAVENLVDGVFYNSGQSCCAIERIYVHHSLFKNFVEAFVEQTKKYVLGNPLEHSTSLGPVVRTQAAEVIREKTSRAILQGAKALIEPTLFKANQSGTPYLAPQVLIDVEQHFDIMQTETFGPVIGIMSVQSDAEALEKMNDSHYGLTASVWTSDEEKALEIGEQLQTGTVFMNRCDYLDPALAWVGVKDSGRGCTLSKIGYEQLTRPKSFHLRMASSF